MTNYDNNLTGALFKNDKEGNESRPDYRGSAEVDRVQYWVSGWIKTSKKGDKFMSLKFQPKQVNEVKGGRNREPDFDDDISF